MLISLAAVADKVWPKDEKGEKITSGMVHSPCLDIFPHFDQQPPTLNVLCPIIVPLKYIWSNMLHAHLLAKKKTLCASLMSQTIYKAQDAECSQKIYCSMSS